MAASTATSSSGPANVPISTQILQLDQEITTVLQEIDQNFTTCHQIVTSRILPAVNRYGVASARTWQGAKFWKHFFEVSADVALTARVDDQGDGYDDGDTGQGNASYEQSTTLDGESEAHTTFHSDDVTASPRSDAGTELYDQSIDQPHPRRGARHGAAATGDDSGEISAFDSAAAGPRRSSPPRFSNASMAAAARREADKKKQQQQQQQQQQDLDGGDASFADPTESPFERLRRDLTQDLGRPDDSNNDSILHAHEKQSALASRGSGANRVYYDDVTNDQTIEVDRSQLAQDVENLDISRTGYHGAGDVSGSSSIAPPPRLSKPIGSSSPGRHAKRPAATTPRSRGPLLNKVLNSEQRKRDAGGSGRRPRDSLPRFEVTPRGSSSASNPFAQPASVKMWNGIVDLRKTPLTSRMQKSKGSAGNNGGGASGNRGKEPSRRDNGSEWDSAEEDGEDNNSYAWPAGMSPPMTMQFSVPQSKYAKTPAKEAAKLMVEDLLKSVGATRSVGQANPRAPASASTSKGRANSSRETPGQPRGNSAAPGSAASTASSSHPPRAGSARPAGPVDTPLQRSKREAKAVDRAAAAAGRHRRRDSMPTPPTLTKRGPSLSAAGGGGATSSRPRMSTTPEVTPQAGSFAANSSGSLLRRGPAGAGLDGSEASSAAAMLMDEDEGLTTGRGRRAMGPSSSDDGYDDEEEEQEVPANLGTKLSAVALQSQMGGAAASAAGGGAAVHALPEEDEDSSEDSSLDSDDDDEEDDEDDDGGLQAPGSVASSRFSSSSNNYNNQPGNANVTATATGTGWSTSSFSSNSRVGGGGARSIEDDTLFGVPKPQPRDEGASGGGGGGGGAGLRNPFSSLAPSSSSSATAAAAAAAGGGARRGGAGDGEGGGAARDFVVWGQVDEMGTVHGGRPLIDR
ncbi:uncharacterized protein PSFLO_06317 [Pseudozyma flocculosa]|uniref:DASH complex subunit ASK1 n=2 Tax=Pseudozyma flocculosa TaxID=84751 RepID=A0A5C3FAX9_9BASI|nr:uncharacterized protein PSFLO_06317 [Pseudozyma flocculosa]